MNIDKLAKTKMPILIQGESGTGKTRLARLIHGKSHQNQAIYMQLNVASLTEELFKSELFGHIKGSFTGAISDKIGFCESTVDGTLFLDEIGELSLSQQASLLTLIDEGYFYKVGSTKKITFRGRLIFATNKDLAREVEEKRFRSDLYYRLRFCLVELEPLRDKIDKDKIIIEMINQLKLEQDNFQMTFSSCCLDKLSQYFWPGNYRELKNTINYLLMLGQMKVTKDDIPSWILSKENGAKDYVVYKDALADFEQTFLKKNLKRYQGKINHTALKTGINKVTLISKLKKYDINRKLYINSGYRQADGF